MLKIEFSDHRHVISYDFRIYAIFEESFFYKIKKKLSPDLKEEALYEILFQLAKDWVLYKLSQQQLFSEELKEKLQKKGFSSTIIDPIITLCINSGWIDDLSWGQQLVTSMQNKKWGLQKIKQKLRLKKISFELIEELTQVNDLQASDLNNLKTVLQKKFPDLPREWKEKQKAARYLINKGFSHQLVFEHLNSLS